MQSFITNHKNKQTFYLDGNEIRREQNSGIFGKENWEKE